MTLPSPVTESMARPRKGYRVVFGLFLAGLVAFIWIDSADWGVQRPTARLRNGATVELVGVTRSAPHRFTLGNPTQRLMRGIFPNTTWEWLGGHSNQADLDAPASEVIWFRYRQNRPTSFMDEERIYITDEHGCRSDEIEMVVIKPLLKDPAELVDTLRAWFAAHQTA